VDGLIGRRAGPTVKILPSTIYWSGLQRWGILAAPLSPDQVALRRRLVQEDADELAERQGGAWHPTLPAAPAGFPDDCPGGFDLTVDEAEWLRDRILDRAPGSLLAHLVAVTSAPDPASAFPWFDTVTVDAPATVADVLRHARWFSLVMHGPALLYNLLVAEAYVAAGHNAVSDTVDEYRAELESWASDVEDQRSGLKRWDTSEFWATVVMENPRIRPLTRRFVDVWVDRAVHGSVAEVAEDQELRGVVRERERFQKKSQARLSNPRLLASWSGASGAAPLTFRWSQVRRIVTDIHDGMGGDRAGA
jgi:hypothetical protein